MLQSGMEAGANESWDQLAELVEGACASRLTPRREAPRPRKWDRGRSCRSRSGVASRCRRSAADGPGPDPAVSTGGLHTTPQAVSESHGRAPPASRHGWARRRIPRMAKRTNGREWYLRGRNVKPPERSGKVRTAAAQHGMPNMHVRPSPLGGIDEHPASSARRRISAPLAVFREYQYATTIVVSEPDSGCTHNPEPLPGRRCARTPPIPRDRHTFATSKHEPVEIVRDVAAHRGRW